MSTSFLLQNVRLSVVQLPLTSLQCTFSFRRYCIFYLYVMRTDVLIRGQSFIFANYCFASSFLQIIKWFTWHSVSALLKQVILKKKKDAIFWITAQELLLSSSSCIVSGGFAIPSYLHVFQYILLSKGGGPVLYFTVDPDFHMYVLCTS